MQQRRFVYRIQVSSVTVEGHAAWYERVRHAPRRGWGAHFGEVLLRSCRRNFGDTNKPRRQQPIPRSRGYSDPEPIHVVVVQGVVWT